MTIHTLKHIIVGMSGGVDSSVSAYLLKKQGHWVEGVFMKNWEEDDTDNYCPASVDMADARKVCEQLDIGFTTINFATEYWASVFEYFLAEYKSGRTPNPDILCNKEIKFKAFLNYAKTRGADCIATGHYARAVYTQNGVHLLKGCDTNKDQSYFLYALNQTQLSQSLFPLGELNKTQVRQFAFELGLENHAKKDSTGICFVGERKFKDFLSQFLPAKKGDIQTTEGNTIGQHDGLMFYTIGQRQGLNIGGKKNAAQAPWFVLAKDIASNVLIVGQGNDHPLLYSQRLFTKDIHWIHQPTQAFPLTVQAKTRYRQPDQPCVIHQLTENDFRIDFITPQRAITPGQSIVFYDQSICLGGTVIISAA